MRVIHVSSGSVGGAGNAAKRLHDGLLDAGIDSNFLTLNLNDSTIQRKFEIRRNLRERLVSFMSSRFHARISKYSFFSSWSISIHAAMKQLRRVEKNSTVIHIHNWYNILSLENISELINSNYRVVFTLHDQRIFTGGCHFSFSCTGFKSHCNQCPQLNGFQISKPIQNLQHQRKILGSKNNVRFIAPSHWIADQMASSGICEQSAIQKISNVNPKLDSIHKEISKQSDWLVIGIASVHPYSYIKGGDLVRKLEKCVNQSVQKIKVEFLKNYSSSDHRSFWEKIDFLLVPSISDNSPNVIHEAKILGIPVIATRVGGIPEMLSEPYDQVLDENKWEFEDLFKRCKKLKSDVQFEHYKNEMKRHYAQYIGSPIDLHITCYEELLASH